MRQPEDKPFFRVSMRSSKDVDVAAICAQFGGGGHVRAAGCTIEARHIDDVEEMLVDSIRKAMGN